MELEGYSRPTYDKFVHLALIYPIVVGVIYKRRVCWPHQYTDNLLWQHFLSPKSRNYSRDPDHAHVVDSQSSQS